MGEFEFEEAFRKFFEEIREKAKNCCNLKLLKTTSFVEHDIETPKGIFSCTMNFYHALDFAYEIGLLKNEEMQNSIYPILPELLEVRIKTAFLEAECEINKYYKETEEKITIIKEEIA